MANTQGLNILDEAVTDGVRASTTGTANKAVQFSNSILSPEVKFGEQSFSSLQQYRSHSYVAKDVNVSQKAIHTKYSYPRTSHFMSYLCQFFRAYRFLELLQLTAYSIQDPNK
jgi:hypothetical protein